MRRRVILSTLALGLVVLVVLTTQLRLAVLSVAYLAVVTPWLVVIDLRERRLPNALVLPALGLGLISIGLEWLSSGGVPVVPLIAGTAYAAFLLLMHIVGGMGMGDVKLGGALGLASWTTSVAVLSPVIAFAAGGVVAIVLLLSGRRGQRIAFGPYLLGGYWAAVAIVVAVRLAT